jgi:hypothetical protein
MPYPPASYNANGANYINQSAIIKTYIRIEIFANSILYIISQTPQYRENQAIELSGNGIGREDTQSNIHASVHALINLIRFLP